MFYFYSFIYSKVILNQFIFLLNIDAILKNVENQLLVHSVPCQSQCGQQLFGFPPYSQYLLTDVNVCGAVQYIDTVVPELPLIECVL